VILIAVIRVKAFSLLTVPVFLSYNWIRNGLSEELEALFMAGNVFGKCSNFFGGVGESLSKIFCYLATFL